MRAFAVILVLFVLVLILFVSCKKEESNPILSETLPTNGLIAYYPFNGNANDESGNSYNGIVHGATLTTDRVGNSNRAYLFNGVNNFIECSDPILSNNLTIALWVKTTDTSNDRKEIINGGNRFLTNQGYHFYKQGKVVRFDLSNSPSTVSTSNINDGQWHFLVGICSSSSIKLFFDSVLQSNFTVDPQISKDKLYIGMIDPINVNSYWSGAIDDIRIYNRALTDSEIQQLYHEGGL